MDSLSCVVVCSVHYWQAVAVTRARIKDLTKERRRVKRVKRQFVESSIWQAGVVQRIKTVELRRYLRKEIEVQREKLKNLRLTVTDQNMTIESTDIASQEAHGDLILLQKKLRDLIECIRQGAGDFSQAAADALVRYPFDEMLHWRNQWEDDQALADETLLRMETDGEQLTDFGGVYGNEIMPGVLREVAQAVDRKAELARQEEARNQERIAKWQAAGVEVDAPTAKPAQALPDAAPGLQSPTAVAGEGHLRADDGVATASGSVAMVAFEQNSGGAGTEPSEGSNALVVDHRPTTSDTLQTRPTTSGVDFVIRYLIHCSKRGVVTRTLPAVERNEEEKRWIAIDRVLNPHLYQNLTEVSHRGWWNR